MTTLLLATGNLGKLAEMRHIVASEGLALEVIGLADVPAAPEPEETELTFEGNALVKARTWAGRTGLAALADDSGLCVDVLGGSPGVRSARWAGPEGDDQANLDLLLHQISDVPPGRRQAHFTCAMALVLPDGTEHVRRAEWPGDLALEPAGDNGFGYDPVFVPAGRRQTSAQLSSEEKNTISHRGQALRLMIPVIEQALLGKAD